MGLAAYTKKELIAKAIQAGKQRICLTSPTGGGKSRIVQRIVEWGKSSLFVVNRVMLVE